MSKYFLCAALAVLVCASIAIAGTVDASTVTYGPTVGYTALLSSPGQSMTMGTLVNGPDEMDTFFHVASGGGNLTHDFHVQLTNITGAPISGYRFHLGVVGVDVYHALDIDGDGHPDYNDVDQDNDGIANSVDNAPWFSNPSQVDTDNDGWGDAIDFRPSSAAVPLGLVGTPQVGPFIFAPTFISLANFPSLAFTNVLSTSAGGIFLRTDGSDLVWAGVLPADQTVTFDFQVIVPDGLQGDGFMIGQGQFDTPEPASALSMSLLTTLFCRRRRR